MVVAASSLPLATARSSVAAPVEGGSVGSNMRAPSRSSAPMASPVFRRARMRQEGLSRRFETLRDGSAESVRQATGGASGEAFYMRAGAKARIAPGKAVK